MWKSRKEPLIRIEITSYKILVIAAIIAIVLYTWRFLLTIFIILYIAFIIASLLRQISKRIHEKLNKKVNIKLVQLLVFLLSIGIFFGLVINIMSQLVNQTTTFIAQILTPEKWEPFINNLQQHVLPFVDINAISNWITTVTTNIVNLQTPIQGAKWAINVLPFTVFILLATWYLLVDFQQFLDNLTILFPSEHDQKLIKYLFEQLDIQVGKWAKAQLLLMFLVGLASFIVLNILQIPYALLLATLAGLLEIIPNFGPTIAAIPAILAGLIAGGPIKALSVLIGYILIQQLENNFLVPYIMGSVAGTHPLTTILLIMLGQTLLGPVGAILSIPVYITIVTLIRAYKDFDTIHYARSNTKTGSNSKGDR